MRLKEDYITQEIDGVQFLVPMGAESFSGVVRSNRTAALIVDLLKQETDREEIVDALCAKFDAPRELIAADVDEILGVLKRVSALEE